MPSLFDLFSAPPVWLTVNVPALLLPSVGSTQYAVPPEKLYVAVPVPEPVLPRYGPYVPLTVPPLWLIADVPSPVSMNRVFDQLSPARIFTVATSPEFGAIRICAPSIPLAPNDPLLMTSIPDGPHGPVQLPTLSCPLFLR